MGHDFLILVLILIFSYSSRFYSQAVSIIFENIFIKFFRTLAPNYINSYFRSAFLAMISFRNQGMTYTSLSFLNSGIIQIFQALGFIFGSYLGLSLSLFILNINDPQILYVFAGVTLFLSFVSDRSSLFRVSKLFFYLCLVLISFSFLVYTLSHPGGAGHFETLIKQVMGSRYLIVPFTLVCFLLFKNSFTVLGLLYALKLSYGITDIHVLVGAVTLFVYNSFYFLVVTNNSHRETKLIAFIQLFLVLSVSVICLSAFYIYPLSFFTMLIVYALVLGLLGLMLAPSLSIIAENLFPRMLNKTTRSIQLYSSVYNYPVTLLIEFYYQEYKKLFVHTNATFELTISNLIKQDSATSEKIHKYFEIAEKVFLELYRLEIHLHEIEKTQAQAKSVTEYSARLRSLSRLMESIRFFQDVSASHLHDESHILFFQKINDSCGYLLSQLLEHDDTKRISISTHLADWDIFSKKLEEQKEKGQLESGLCSEMQIHSMKMIESLKSLS